jgi:hypothetical protein
MAAGAIDLPDYFDRELNVAGLRHQVLQLSSTTRRSVQLENLGLAGVKKRQGRPEVGVIHDIEKLRPELHAEALRNLLHGEVLVQREIQVDHRGTGDAIAAGIAQQIRTRAGELRARQRPIADKGHALPGRRTLLGQRVAARVDVTQENPARIALEIAVGGGTSGNQIRNGEWVAADILYLQSVSSDDGSCRNPAIHLDNATHLPSAQRCLR